MPLLLLLRLLFSILSLGILVGAGYLLWSWYDGEAIQRVDGVTERVREDWQLWTGLALLAWSFLGRLIVLPLLARPDRQRPGREDREKVKLERSASQTLRGASGADLYVEVSGPDDAQPIILVHGWGLDSTIWDYARRDLGERYRLIRWDLTGAGRSRAPVNAVGLSQFASDLRSVIGLAGERPVILVGHSIGGMTIQTLARDDRDFVSRSVARVVLLNTTYTNPLETSVLSGLAKALRWPVLEPALWLTKWLGPLSQLSAWQSYLSGSSHLANRFGFGRDVTRSQLEATTLLATRNPQDVLAQGNLAMFRWDASEALVRFPVPVLILTGSKDLLTKAEASRSMAERMPEADLQVIDGAGHMGFLERSDVYNGAIAKFAQEAAAEKATASGEPPRDDDLLAPPDVSASHATERLNRAQRPFGDFKPGR